ncbi:MAG: MFS transporter [Cyclobacteriaceae bacterium]
MAVSQLLGVILSLVVAFYLDYIELRFVGWQLESYSLLFGLGAICGTLNLYLLYRTPELKMQSINDKIFGLLRKPFQHLNFRNLIVYQASWNFAVNLAAPFFTVYLLRRLDYSLTYVIGFTVLSQLVNIFFLRLWGRYSDSHGYKSVLNICAPLYLFSILLWTFTTLPEKHDFTLPLLVLIYVLGGIATAGTSLAAGNIGLKLSPKGEAIAYLSVMSFINSVSAGITPIIGGLGTDFFLNKQLSISISWLNGEEQTLFNALSLEQWDFFFAFSFLLGLYAVHRLAYLEEGEQSEEVSLLREIRLEIQREMRGMSTVTGLRSMVHLPFSLYQVLSRKK